MTAAVVIAPGSLLHVMSLGGFMQATPSDDQSASFRSVIPGDRVLAMVVFVAGPDACSPRNDSWGPWCLLVCSDGRAGWVRPKRDGWIARMVRHDT